MWLKMIFSLEMNFDTSQTSLSAESLLGAFQQNCVQKTPAFDDLDIRFTTNQQLTGEPRLSKSYKGARSDHIRNRKTCIHP